MNQQTGSSVLYPDNYILFNSRLRSAGTITNAYYSMANYPGIIKMRLQNFTMFNGIYAISSTLGDTFIITETAPGATATITIASGTYTGSQFASAISTILNNPATGLTNSYSVVFDPITLKLTITEATGIGLTFSLSWPSSGGMYYQMGYGSTLPSATSFALTQISPFAVQLVNVNKIGVLFTQGGSIPTNGWSNCSSVFQFSIDMQDNFGSQLAYRPFTLMENTIMSSSLARFAIGGYVNIKLIDLATGLEIDANGSEYQLLLELFTYKC